MNDIRATSWAELTALLYSGSWNEAIGRFRSNYAFRGTSDTSQTLCTSLQRLGGDYSTLEAHLLRNFRKYAYRDAVPYDSIWNWLVLAQHHGLPTRLLDWSYSPYVALHFATERLDCYDRDGAIWAVDYVKLRDYLPEALETPLREEGSNVLTVEMLQQRAPSLQALAALAPEPFSFFFEPPSLNERIVNQYALLSSTSDAASRLDGWLADKQDLVRRIIVPAALKWEVRDKLDQANITERVLFPGLDGLSRWLTRLYTPSGPRYE